MDYFINHLDVNNSRLNVVTFIAIDVYFVHRRVQIVNSETAENKSSPIFEEI